MESAITKLIDSVSTMETTSRTFQVEMKSEITSIKQKLDVVISDQNDLKALVENSSRCCQSTKSVVEKNDKALQKIQTDLTECSNKIATAAANPGTGGNALGKLQADVNTVNTNILELTQTANSLKTDIASVKLGPGAKPKKPQGAEGEEPAAENKITDRSPPIMKADIDTFIITDSISRQLKPEMFTQHKCQIAAYGGLDNRELKTILEQIPPCDHVQSAVLHSGYKDSKFGPTVTSQREVVEIIATMKTAFPKATIFVGSTLPRKKNLNRTNIDDYNRTLDKACTEANALYISLTPCVTSNDGKKVTDAMFEDSIHLGIAGAKAMAGLITTFLPVSPYPPSSFAKPLNTETNHKEADNEDDDEDDEDIRSQLGEDDEDKEAMNEAYDNYQTPEIKTFPFFKAGANKFQAHVAKVHSQADVRKVICTVNSRAFDATTNTVAYRFAEGKKKTQEVIDDGEKDAGQVMLDALNDYRVPNTIVIISRYYGGKLGDPRFKIYYDLTVAAIGQDPRQERPPPNKYPRSEKSPPLDHQQPQNFHFSAQWRQQKPQKHSQPMSSFHPKQSVYQEYYPGKQPYFIHQPYQMQQPHPMQQSYPILQPPQFYNQGQYSKPAQNSQNRNRRYTYFDGQRVTVQYAPY